MFAVSKMGNVEGECDQGNVCPTLHEATYSGLMLLLLLLPGGVMMMMMMMMQMKDARFTSFHFYLLKNWLTTRKLTIGPN